MLIKQVFLYIIGFTTLLLGIIGIIVPVLPTTPFILLSLSCFAGCNKIIYKKIKKVKYISEYINTYEKNSGVSMDTKKKSIVFLWLGLLISVIIIQDLLVLNILIIIGVIVTSHIVLLKTKSVI